MVPVRDRGPMLRTVAAHPHGCGTVPAWARGLGKLPRCRANRSKPALPIPPTAAYVASSAAWFPHRATISPRRRQSPCRTTRPPPRSRRGPALSRATVCESLRLRVLPGAGLTVPATMSRCATLVLASRDETPYVARVVARPAAPNAPSNSRMQFRIGRSHRPSVRMRFALHDLPPRRSRRRQRRGPRDRRLARNQTAGPASKHRFLGAFRLPANLCDRPAPTQPRWLPRRSLRRPVQRGRRVA